MAKFEVIGSGVSYAVMGAGVEVGGPYYNFDQAQSALDGFVRKSGIKERRCLTCDELFMSEGAHNRMCDRCRTNSDIYQGAV